MTALANGTARTILDQAGRSAFLASLDETPTVGAGLRVIRGRINSAAPGTILQGAGFTITRNGTGDVTVNYNTPFNGVPAVTSQIEATAGGANVAQIQGGANAPTASKVRFQLVNQVGPVVEDAVFNFIAVGLL